eukprot:jgi/Tetstr1/422597/TSEL_013404.t1
MLARFENAGVEFTPSAWAVTYADHVARCSGGDSNHAAHEWAAHGLSDVCHDVKSALGVGVQILTDPSVLVSLPKGSDGRPADERHKIQKYDEGVRNAAGMLRFVPLAVSEFGSLAPHAEAFLVELAKASHTHTGQKIGQLLSAWRRRFSLLINMAHVYNVLGFDRALTGREHPCATPFQEPARGRPWAIADHHPDSAATIYPYARFDRALTGRERPCARLPMTVWVSFSSSSMSCIQMQESVNSNKVSAMG